MRHSRALAFYGDARQLSTSRSVLAVVTYYVLFHLSTWLIFSCPQLLTGKERRSINEALASELMDPSPAVRHSMATKFVKRCVAKGLPQLVYTSLVRAQQIREAVNYGPRARMGQDASIEFNSCQTSPSELEPITAHLDQIFEDVIRWTLQHGEDGGIWVAGHLGQLEQLFVKPQQSWNGWLSSDAAITAETLRARLATVAREHEDARRAALRAQQGNRFDDAT